MPDKKSFSLSKKKYLPASKSQDKPRIPARGIIYVVGKYETLPNIAKRFKTTESKIMEDNNMTDPSLIYPGKRLVIK